MKMITDEDYINSIKVLSDFVWLSRFHPLRGDFEVNFKNDAIANSFSTPEQTIQALSCLKDTQPVLLNRLVKNIRKQNDIKISFSDFGTIDKFNMRESVYLDSISKIAYSMAKMYGKPINAASEKVGTFLILSIMEKPKDYKKKNPLAYDEMCKYLNKIGYTDIYYDAENTLSSFLKDVFYKGKNKMPVALFNATVKTALSGTNNFNLLEGQFIRTY